MSSWDSSSDSALFAQHIKAELERLTQAQEEATECARSFGMTISEQEQFDARQRRITQLIEHLAIFE